MVDFTDIPPDISTASGALEPGPSAGGSHLAEFARHWPVLLGSALGAALGAALFPLYVMPLLGLQLEHLLGWSRTDSASLLTAMSLGGLLMAIPAGRLIDAVGPRWPAAASTAAMGALLTAAPLLPGSVNAWRVGAFAFAILGCATGPTAYSRAVCDAFSRARGAALGLTLGAIGLAGAIMPSVLIALMGHLGAQHALQVMGVAYVIVLAPLIAVLLGKNAHHRALAAVASVSDRAGAPITRLTRTRWFGLALGFVLLSASAFGAAVSIPGLAHDTHSGPPVLMLAALSLTVMAARPLSGFLIDFAPAQFVAAGIGVCTAVGMAMIALSPHLLPFGAVMIGLSLGAEVDILAFLVSRYSIPSRQSRIFSQIWFMVGVSTSLMPVAFAQGRALGGGYGPVLIAAAVAALTGSILIASLPAYAGARHGAR